MPDPRLYAGPPRTLASGRPWQRLASLQQSTACVVGLHLPKEVGMLLRICSLSCLMTLLALMTALGCTASPETTCEGTARTWLEDVQDRRCQKAFKLVHPSSQAMFGGSDWCEQLEVVHIDAVDADPIDDGCVVSCYGSFVRAGHKQDRLDIYVFEFDGDYLIRWYE